MDLTLLTVASMITLTVLLFLGLPVAFALIATSVLFTLAFLPSGVLNTLAYSVYSTMATEVFMAIPLFLLMASFLEYSGIARDLYDASYKWAGGIRGSLAVATIAGCTLLAAMTGIGSTGVVTMGMIAYPQMERYKYDRRISMGSILLGGALGPIIPPSNLMIILATFTSVSTSQLFMSGILPGIVLAGVTIVFIICVAAWKPNLAPALPRELRPSWKEKFISLRGILVPLAIIVIVIGGIYVGVWTTVEAAGAGAWSTAIYALARRRVGIKEIKDTAMATFRLSVVIYWLIIGGATYSAFMSAAGIGPYLRDILLSLPLGTTGLLALFVIILLILGMFVETLAILMITVPIFIPVVNNLGVDPLWFSMVYVMALVAGYVTPPFGYNLFYLKGTIGEGGSMNEIYAAAIPFSFMFVIMLVLLFIFPGLATWLPGLMRK